MRPVEALYEDGFLKPAKPLALRAGESVAVIVMRRPDAARWDLKRHGDASAATDDETLAGAGLDNWADALDAGERR